LDGDEMRKWYLEVSWSKYNNPSPADKVVAISEFHGLKLVESEIDLGMRFTTFEGTKRAVRKAEGHVKDRVSGLDEINVHTTPWKELIRRWLKTT
jgi:hypothetical protein